MESSIAGIIFKILILYTYGHSFKVKQNTNLVHCTNSNIVTVGYQKTEIRIRDLNERIESSRQLSREPNERTRTKSNSRGYLTSTKS